MTKKSLALSLVLAVAFLVAANVNAGLVTSVAPEGTATELFQINVKGDYNNLSFTKGGNYTDYSPFEVVKNETNGGQIIFGLIKFWDYGANTTTFPDFDYFTWSKGEGNGISKLNVNGDLIENGKDIWAAFPGVDQLYFTGYEGADELALVFTTQWFQPSSAPEGKPPYTNYYDFNLTFYAAGDPNVEPDPSGTPEPATLAVLGLGLAGLGVVTRRRRK